jgi:hypothetical protein
MISLSSSILKIQGVGWVRVRVYGLGFEGWCFRGWGERLGSLDSCLKQLSDVPITFLF